MSKRLNIRVTDDMHDHLAVIADIQGGSIQAVVEQVLAEFVKDAITKKAFKDQARKELERKLQALDKLA